MVVSNQIDYGNLTKRIVFTENDHRHANLILKLKHDGLTQAAFFRHLITAYIENDERIQDLVDELRTHKRHKAKSQKMRQKGKEILKDFALSSGEVENIFDVLEREFPEL
jgi:hypothetical protein